MASGYTEGEIERLRRSLSQAHQELSDERARSAKLLDEVGRLRAEVEYQQKVIDSLEESRTVCGEALIEIEEERDALKAKLAELREAAKIADARWKTVLATRDKNARLGADLRKIDSLDEWDFGKEPKFGYWLNTYSDEDEDTERFEGSLDDAVRKMAEDAEALND